MATRTQDLPPPGGYQKIEFKRIPARKYFSGYQMILGYLGKSTDILYYISSITLIILGVSAGSFFLYQINARQVERENIEMRSGRLALYPLLFAERDREFLKQLRRNRDEETKLMKDVPGWVVGTWYGEPVFKTFPKDNVWEPHWVDFCVHADYRTYARRTNFHLWN